MCPINGRSYLAYHRSVQEYYKRCAEMKRMSRKTEDEEEAHSAKATQARDAQGVTAQKGCACADDVQK